MIFKGTFGVTPIGMALFFMQSLKKVCLLIDLALSIVL